METVMNVMVIALMVGNFILFKKRPQIKANEFRLYLGAIAVIIVLIGFYYSFYQFLWAGLAASCGAAFGIGWIRHIEEK